MTRGNIYLQVHYNLNKETTSIVSLEVLLANSATD